MILKILIQRSVLVGNGVKKRAKPAKVVSNDTFVVAINDLDIY